MIAKGKLKIFIPIALCTLSLSIAVLSIKKSISTKSCLSPEIVFFNSDLLYLPILYQDLFVDGNSFLGWKTPPAPYYFPDMAGYFILRFVIKNDIYAYCIYSLIFIIIAAILINSISERVFETIPIIGRILIFSTPTLFIYLTIFGGTQYPAIFNTHLLTAHAGVYIVSLVCCVLLLKNIEKPSKTRHIAIFIFSVITIMSDPLFLFQFIFPALAYLAVIVFLQRVPIKRLLPHGLNLSVASAAGVCFFMIDASRHLTYKQSNIITQLYSMLASKPNNRMLSAIVSTAFIIAGFFIAYIVIKKRTDILEKIWMYLKARSTFIIISSTSLMSIVAIYILLFCFPNVLNLKYNLQLLQDIGKHIRNDDPMTIISLIWLFLSIGNVIFIIAKERTMSISPGSPRANLYYITLFFLLFYLSTLFFTMFRYYDESMLRYIYPFYYLPLFGMPLYIVVFLQKITINLKKDYAISACIVTLVLILQLNFYFRQAPNEESFGNYYPKITQWIDDTSERYGLSIGLAGYWMAKNNTFLSKRNVKILQVLPDMRPYHWINNINWYIHEAGEDLELSKYNFILFSRFGNDRNQFEMRNIYQLFGPPDQIVECPLPDWPDTRLLIYRKGGICFSQKALNCFN